MDNKNINFFKILFLNSLILFVGIILIELILKIRKREPILIIQKFPIKNLVCNVKLKHDVSKLYKDSQNLFSTYERDRNCYRSNSTNENISKILVIGGSTTAQTFLSEGDTFQDILDSKFYKK